MSAAAVGTLAELGGALLTPPAQICATVAARCCPILLPVCLDAVFASLTPEQRSQLATTITTDLAAAAAHHQPAPSYCVVSAGGAPLDIIKRYIETQQSPNRQGRPPRNRRP